MSDSTVHNLLVGSWDLSTVIWGDKAKRSDKTFWGATVADLGAGQRGIEFPTSAHRADARATSGAEYVLSFFARADVAGDRIHSEVWGSLYMLDTELTTGWQQVVMPYGIRKADARDVYFWGLGTNSGTVHVALPMCVRGDTPAAWAPAEGETLAGVGALMSANLWNTSTENFKPDANGVYLVGKSTDELKCTIAGASALSANQTVHFGASLRGAGKGYLSPFVEYRNAVGNLNWVGFPHWTPTDQWQRFEATCVVPSGMTITKIGFNTSGATGDIEVMNPAWSYGSPVVLASSAHTPYATQDHVAAEYATKAALKVTSDAVTAEVTERGRLAGRVGTLESTTGTHTSKLEQLATSIKSLVKGESTYTDPDGKSATSGIYSLVTQTRDSVTALFGQYTKTADLASTQAVKDAKKAGTDAQAAASAAQTTADSASSTAGAAKSTADSLATMVRQYSGGVLVGRVGQGVGALVNAEGSFDVVGVTWSGSTPKVGYTLATFSDDSTTFFNPKARIKILSYDGDTQYGTEVGNSNGTSYVLGSSVTIKSSSASVSAFRTGDVHLNSSGGIYANGLMLGPVHSMYNPNNGQHVYTGKASEISDLESNGWTDEGVKFYAFLGIDNR